MAYLKDTPKCITCPKKSTKILVDRWNGERGSYCGTCAAKALKQLQKIEGKNNG